MGAKLAGSGDAQQSTEVAQANAIITTFKYNGEKRNYTFENHYSKMLNAYNSLEEKDNKVAPERQVTNFMKSITDK